MAVNIRRFDFERDIRDIMAWIQDLYEPNFPDLVITSEFMARRRQALRAAARDPWEKVFVAVDASDRAVGFVWVFAQDDWNGRRRGEVAAIYVVRERRSQGVGRLLLEEAELALRHWGCRTVQLTVTATNLPAVSLYERKGYQTTRYHMEKPL